MSVFRKIIEWLSGRPTPRPDDHAGEEHPRPDAPIVPLPQGVQRIIALHDRAQTKLQTGRWAEAIRDLDQVIASAPLYADAYLNRGACALSLKDEEAAIVDFSRAIALFPDSAMKLFAYLNRASAYEQMGRLRAAVADARTARRLAADMPVTEQQLAGAEIEQQLARLERKESEGDRTDDDPPLAERAAARSREGWSLKQRGDLLDALVAFDAAAALAPGDPGPYYGRGVVNCMMKRTKQALADLDRALAIQPHLPGPLAERGMIRAEAGDFDGAMRDYDLAIESNPRYAPAHFNKGSAFALQQRFSEALPYFDTAIRLSPDNPDFYFNRGYSCMALGDRSRAMADLSKYVQMCPRGAMSDKAREHITGLERDVLN